MTHLPLLSKRPPLARAFRSWGVALLSLLALPSEAQTATAAGPLLTPDQFLGYKLGTQFTPHAEILRYVDHVVAHTPGRMKLVPYGKTYENRPWRWCRLPAPITSAASKTCATTT
ncbi:hypothetical protein ACFQT0_17405 [Hymenobacter humi]|uniref:Uncharacterized protein n=1 Tax=Hymenobacter humi TaxID=1411620 RepID=A0ABW2U9P5_9BACT